MSQPLAVLNDEEMHWLNDLGLPNQRRWLNHRTLGDEHRRTFPSAATDISISSHKEAHKHKKRLNILKRQVVGRRRQAVRYAGCRRGRLLNGNKIGQTISLGSNFRQDGL